MPCRRATQSVPNTIRYAPTQELERIGVSVTSYQKMMRQRPRVYREAADVRIPLAIAKEEAAIRAEIRAREQGQLRRELLQEMRETARRAFPLMRDQGRVVHTSKTYGTKRYKRWYLEQQARVLGCCHYRDPRYYLVTESGRIFHEVYRPLQIGYIRVGYHSTVTNAELRSIIRHLRKIIDQASS
jgi:hypothetical protein